MLHLAFMVSAIALASDLIPIAEKPQWENQDPATRDWFKSLRSPSGFPCCDFTDGTRIEDPNYRENEDHTYEVFAGGKWLHVPIEKVVAGTNRIGYAVLWGRPELDMVYCFMPGARG